MFSYVHFCHSMDEVLVILTEMLAVAIFLADDTNHGEILYWKFNEFDLDGNNI